MRIAIVTETWPPEINGVALTVQALAVGLVAQGHAVEVIRPRVKADNDPDLSSRVCNEVAVPGARVPRYPMLRFGLPAGRLLLRRWQAEKPDVLYAATEGPLGWSALAIARKLGIPVSSGFHTRFDDFADHYGLGLIAPAVLSYLRRFHNRAQVTLVPTAELAAVLERNGFHNVRVLRRAVDVELFHPMRRDRSLRAAWGVGTADPVLLQVGRIAPEKNLALAVKAFRAIQRRQPQARLVMVGDGPDRGALAAQNPDVVFTGALRGDDLARCYASADVFLFPSLTETFGNVTLEAMASGLAVVAFDYAAAREMIVDASSGVLVPFGDADAFVSAALALACDIGCRARMRACARAVAESVSSPHQASACFAQLLASLMLREAA
ncbi:MAG: glycosyltransferase family 1 protein [Rhodanobacteraceae bacterium]